MIENMAKKEKLIADITKSIHWYLRRHRIDITLQWVLTAIIAAAGVLTSTAGIQQGDATRWFLSSDALIAWGLIAAVGAGINQVGNPGAAAERHLNIKLTLKRIRFDLEYGRLPVEEAADLVGMAVKDPDKAAQALEERLQQASGPSSV